MDLKSLIDIIQNNQALTLLFGGSVVTASLYYLKSLPSKLYKLLVWRFTSHVQFTNDDSVFKTVSDWLSHQEFCQKARHLRCDTSVDDHTQMTKVRLCPGLGGTYFWYKGKPFLLHRENPSGGQDRFGRPVEIITIRSLGSSPSAIHSLIDEVQTWSNQSTGTIDVYLYRGYWQKVSRKTKRALSSIILPEDQKQRLISDIEGFLSSKKWYTSMGIPYRRGMLFWGVPGTGKTSLAMGLAGMFDLRIYAINLGSVENDQDLVNAITQIPEKSMLLIEDIDAATAKDREDDDTGAKITLAGLLNAIDGVFSRDGRLLVMTTNYPDKLDKALTRPGRVDLMEEISPLAAPEVLTMCKQFLGDRGSEFARQFDEPVIASELQRLLIQKKNSL
jgi:chaperone BCS1